MTKLLEQAIAEARKLTDEEQDALAAALLAMVGDTSLVPIDAETRAAIREGSEQADRGEFVPDDVVAAADKRHGI
jgi:hypothetical protein